MAKSQRGAATTNATDTATKGYVDGRVPKTTVAATAPTSPATGDVWIDTSQAV